jgi:transport and Golgi organization protein 2
VCVLIIAVGLRDDARLVVAANRDEAYDRPASPPEVGSVGGRRVLFPRDLQAGGTWEGMSESGLVVVITNRPDGTFDPGRPSRGLLCREALGQPDAVAVSRFLESEVGRQRYNSFNLFYADQRSAYVSSWNGTLRTVELEPGTHVLSNDHPLGSLRLPELGSLPRQSSGELRAALVKLQGSHEDRDATGFRICKHGEMHGTVSASLLHWQADGTGILEHAAGPPCRTPFVPYAIPAPRPAPTPHP